MSPEEWGVARNTEGARLWVQLSRLRRQLNTWGGAKRLRCTSFRRPAWRIGKVGAEYVSREEKQLLIAALVDVDGLDVAGAVQCPDAVTVDAHPVAAHLPGEGFDATSIEPGCPRLLDASAPGAPLGMRAARRAPVTACPIVAGASSAPGVRARAMMLSASHFAQPAGDQETA